MDLNEARRLLEAQLSHSEQDEALRAAVRAAHPDASWVNFYDGAVYDDHVVYRISIRNAADAEIEKPADRKLFYRRGYSIDDDGVVTLGEPTEVRKNVTFEPVVPAQEALAQVTGVIVPLRESKGQARQVKIIEPGWGSSGFWPAEVLERDGPAAFPAGTHQYIDHPTASEESERPERSVRDLAATLATDAVWQADGPDGPGLYAETTVTPTYDPLIDAVAEDIGVSVNTWAVSEMGEAEGKRGPIIKRIASATEAPLSSVDFVTKAGAGGKLMPLLESARAKAGTPTPDPAPQHEGHENQHESVSAPKEGHEMDEKQLKEQLEAAQREASELREKNEGLTTENSRLRETVAVSEARTVVAEKLSAAELPEFTKQRLTESLVKGVSLAEDGTLAPAFGEAVEAAIADEVDYVAKLTESGKVRDQGGSAAASDAVKESFKSRYLAQGMSEEQAERMAVTAAAGR